MDEKDFPDRCIVLIKRDDLKPSLDSYLVDLIKNHTDEFVFVHEYSGRRLLGKTATAFRDPVKYREIRNKISGGDPFLVELLDILHDSRVGKVHVIARGISSPTKRRFVQIQSNSMEQLVNGRIEPSIILKMREVRLFGNEIKRQDTRNSVKILKIFNENKRREKYKLTVLLDLDTTAECISKTLESSEAAVVTFDKTQPYYPEQVLVEYVNRRGNFSSQEVFLKFVAASILITVIMESSTTSRDDEEGERICKIIHELSNKEMDQLIGVLKDVSYKDYWGVREGIIKYLSAHKENKLKLRRRGF